MDAVGWLLDAGRIKLYAVDSYDAWSWSDTSLSLEERARRHGDYEAWLIEQVVPWIHADCAGRSDLIATGVSLGAFHAVNLALRRADLVPLAIGLSGNYDPASWSGWGSAATRRTSPTPRTTSRTCTATTWTGCAAI